MRRIGLVTKLSNEQITFFLDESVDFEELKRLANGKKLTAEIRFNDNRVINSEQRKKIYALFADISRWSGYTLLEIKEIMKVRYCLKENINLFSLSDCSLLVARDFISYIIDFCFEWNVGFKEMGLQLHDDITKYLWLCIKHRKCALCGKHADIHHVDTVGMGRDRRTVNNEENRLIALCRIHHVEVGTIGQETFDKKYHVTGIKISKENIKDFRI